jgi:hypothetical protein
MWAKPHRLSICRRGSRDHTVICIEFITRNFCMPTERLHFCPCTPAASTTHRARAISFVVLQSLHSCKDTGRSSYTCRPQQLNAVDMKRIGARRKDSTLLMSACREQHEADLQVAAPVVVKRSSKIVVPCEKVNAAIPALSGFASFQEGFLMSARSRILKGDKYW